MHCFISNNDTLVECALYISSDICLRRTYKFKSIFIVTVKFNILTLEIIYYVSKIRRCFTSRKSFSDIYYCYLYNINI